MKRQYLDFESIFSGVRRPWFILAELFTLVLEVPGQPHILPVREAEHQEPSPPAPPRDGPKASCPRLQ